MALTYTLQRTAYNPQDQWLAWFHFRHLSAGGTCASNPSAAGYEEHGGSNGCGGRTGYACDDGNGAGAGAGTFTGMSGGSGGTGGGSGGTGTGTIGAGPGPVGTNNNGGSNGAAATTAADNPNTIPSPTNQGDIAKQPEIKPSPFFDGKLFGIGSDSDPATQNDKTISIGGLRIGYGWLYLLGLLALVASVAAGYFLWWRRLPVKERARLRNRLLLRSK